MQTNYRPVCPQYYNYPRVTYSLDQLNADLQAFNTILAQPHQYAGARRDRLKNKVAKLKAIILAEHVRLGIPLETYVNNRAFTRFIPNQSHQIREYLEEASQADGNNNESEDEEDLINQQNEVESGYPNPLPIGPKRLTGWQVIGLAVGTAAAFIIGYGAYKYYTKTVVVSETPDNKTEKADDKSGKPDDKTGKKDDKTGKADDKSGKPDDKTGKKDDKTEKHETPPVANPKPLTWWNRHSFYDVIVNRSKELFSQLSPQEIKKAKHRTERHHDLIKEKLHSGYTLEDLLKTTMPHRNTTYLTKNEYLRIMAEDHLHDHRSSKIELNEKNLLVNIGILPSS